MKNDEIKRTSEKPTGLQNCRGVKAVGGGYTANFSQNGKPYYLGRYITYTGAAIAVLSKRIEIFRAEEPVLMREASDNRKKELLKRCDEIQRILEKGYDKTAPEFLKETRPEPEELKSLQDRYKFAATGDALEAYQEPNIKKRIDDFTEWSTQLYQYNLAAFKTGVDIRETKAEKPHQGQPGQPGQPGHETEQERRIRLDEAKQERKNRQIEEEINEATDKHLLDTLTYLKFITSLHTDRTPVVIETEYRAQQLRSQMAARKRIRQNKKDSTKKLKAERKQELINLRNQEEELF